MKRSFYLQSLLFFCFILMSVTTKAAKPAILTGPANASICEGDSTRLFIEVDSIGVIPARKFTWEVSTDGGTVWTVITTGAPYRINNDTVVITANSGLNGNLYRATVTNGAGDSVSSSAMLTVLFPDAGTISGPTMVCRGGGTISLGSTVLGGVWFSLHPSIATVNSTTGVVTGVAFGYDTVKYAVTNSCGPDTAMYVIHVDSVVTAKPILGPGATCVGNFLTLTNANTTFGTGVWSTSNTSASISSSGVLTGTANGNVVVSYDFTNGCGTVTSTKSITVDTVLDAGVISGPSIVCNGSSIALSETVGGGIWISTPPSVAIADPSGNVTGVSQGTATISYFLSNACGASAATFTVTVESGAAPITSKDSVGIGASRTMTNATIGGMWFSLDTSIAKIDTFTGVVTGIDTGTTTLVYRVTNVCGTTSRNVFFHVGPPPFPGTIYGTGTFDSSVCLGATTTVLDSAKFGVGVWSSKWDTVATIDPVTGVVTGVGYGLDTLFYTFTNAFGSSKARLPFFVNDKPNVTISGPALVAIGGNYFFRGTPYYSWRRTPNAIIAPKKLSDATIGVWSDSNSAMGVFIATVDSSNLHLTSFGSYVVRAAGRDKITYTVSNGCGTSQKSFSIFLQGVNGTPVVNETSSALSVFPNPAENEITVNLKSDMTEQATMTITNVAGAVVKQLSMTTNNTTKVKLDEPAGVYFMSVTTATGNYTARIVISK